MPFFGAFGMERTLKKKVSGKLTPPPTPKQVNPWDVPLHLPFEGDMDENAIYLSVGKALSQWERLEHQMSNIFAAVVSKSADNPARWAYGAVMASGTRADMLKGAAYIYFFPLVRTANEKKRAEFEDLQKQLGDLMEEVGKFAARRNNIAHGVVSPYFPPTTGKGGFCLVPPLYATKHYKARPVYPYAFTSKMIDEYATHFARLGKEAYNYAINF
jgi:hypothetical protein